MKNKWEVILSGVGGQGLISCGSLMAEAAIIFEDRYATLSSSYGVETRGTFTKSDIIISDREIFYPEVLKADVILSLAQVAYDKYVSSIDENSILIYDSGMINQVKESKAKQFGYPFTNIARDLGNVTAANIIALGAIVKLTRILEEKAVLAAIEESFMEKPKMLASNIAAFNKGLEIAE